jgi:hypothetical protein
MRNKSMGWREYSEGVYTESLLKIDRDAQDIQDNPVHPC